MRYFTPELLDAGNSFAPAKADAAFANWERAEAEYEAHLKQLWPGLPAAVRTYLETIRLHDADVLGQGLTLDNRQYGLVLRTDESDIVHLRYRLAARTSFRFVQDATSPLIWQYDEIDEFPSAGVPLFVHRILFTGAAELNIPFYDLSCEVYRESPIQAEALTP